jgi:hypothetical protein
MREAARHTTELRHSGLSFERGEHDGKEFERDCEGFEGVRTLCLLLKGRQGKPADEYQVSWDGSYLAETVLELVIEHESLGGFVSVVACYVYDVCFT